MSALVTTGTPGFEPTNDGKRIRFSYTVNNTTSFDYRIASDAEIKLMARGDDNTLGRPIPADVISLEVPVFMPANQKATLALTINFASIPQRKQSETDGQYHEILRNFCRDQMNGDSGLVLFDEINRYEINLPKPADQPPKKTP